MRHLTAIGLAIALHLAGILAAQAQAIGPNGLPIGPLAPPIDPQQVFRSQPQPMTTAPSPTVTAPAGPFNPPAVYAPSLPLSSAPVGRYRARTGRTAHCRDEAVAERVPRRKRAAYVRHCVARRS